MLEDYKNALKSGQRAYRACVARGQSPYLAVLDDILVNVNIVAQEPLGLVEIPAESIVAQRPAAVTPPLHRTLCPCWSRTPSLQASGQTSAMHIWKRASTPPSSPTSPEQILCAGRQQAGIGAQVF